MNASDNHDNHSIALQINNELCNLSPFFHNVSFLAELQHSHFVIYWTIMSADLVVKILFLIVALCGMIVASINEAMRRQAAYRLAWDQKIERDQI